MSIAEFSATIKSQAYRDFFQRISVDTILKTGVSDLRKEEQGAEKTSFTINTDTIGKIITSLAGTEATPEQVTSVLTRLKEVTYTKGRKAVTDKAPYVDKNTLFYPRVSFDTINRILENGFKDILTIARKANPKANISDTFERGHVYGLFPKKVEDIALRISRNTTIDEKGKSILLGILGDLQKELERQDLETSNIKDEKYALYSKYKKSKNKYLVEMQLRTDNQASGSVQSPISKALRKFFSPGNLPVSGKDGLVFGKGSGEQLLQKLIKSKGSPSFIDLVHVGVTSVFTNDKSADKEYAVPFSKINSGINRVNTSRVKADISKDKSKLKSLVSKVKAIPKISSNTSAIPSTVNLLAILQAGINKQVAKNMGKGNESRVLNYRTGRFAESVQVQRLSESRQGMITAFYSYMRNPYGTFSEGGRQQFPKTRDPKLLISKSVRELAAPIVGARMRAVLV